MITEPSLAKNLLEMFFHAPAANAILVFEENRYRGVILKRDVEMGIAEGHFAMDANVNPVRPEELSGLVFRNGGLSPGSGVPAGVPAVDEEGRLIRILSREEFQCQFFFGDFRKEFDTTGVLASLEHPLIVTDVFLKTVYANEKARDLMGGELEGENLGDRLARFHISSVRDSRFLEKDGRLFRMETVRSESDRFAYRVYLFIPA